MKTLRLLYSIFYLVTPLLLFAQNNSSDSLLQEASLQDCIQYALKHQPLIQQSKIDEAITETTIKTKLSEWYPQINGGYILQRYLALPTSFFPDANGNKRATKVGVINSSNI